MRRLVRFLGTALVMVGLAVLLLVAGWNFWPNGVVTPTGGPSAGRAGAALAEQPGTFLVSPTGGAVPAMDAEAYLLQDRPTPGRALTVTMTASLETLLQEGEVLPDPLFQEVMADIRAPILAESLCPILSASLAHRCSVASARVEKGSLDPLTKTAVFRLDIRYSQPSDPDDLPDLARHVLRTTRVDLPETVETATSVESVLQALVSVAEAACAAEGAGLACRVLRIELDHGPGGAARGQAVIGALFPLPDWMRTAPELLPAPKN